MGDIVAAIFGKYSLLQLVNGRAGIESSTYTIPKLSLILSSLLY